jgi:hypothetical protein
MAEKSPSNWKWWCLVVGLAVAHFIVVMIVVLSFLPVVYSGPPRPPYQPPWLYYAFVNVFAFPATAISRIAHFGPKDGVLGISILMLTCLLWGGIWAEPFRRRYGWKPWRFSIRELLVVTTIIAAILGILVLLD